MPSESAEVCALLRSSNAANELTTTQEAGWAERGGRTALSHTRTEPSREAESSAGPLLADSPCSAIAAQSDNAFSKPDKSLLRGAFAPQTQSLCARNDFTLVTGTPSASSRSICHFLMRFSPAAGIRRWDRALEVAR